MKDIQQPTDHKVKLVGLRKIRELRGLKSNELATMIGYDSNKVSRLERGSVGFGSIVLGRLSVALGCTPADLFSDPTDDRLRELEKTSILRRLAQLESNESEIAS